MRLQANVLMPVFTKAGIRTIQVLTCDFLFQTPAHTCTITYTILKKKTRDYWYIHMETTNGREINQIQSKLRDAIAHPCRNISGGLAKPHWS